MKSSRQWLRIGVGFSLILASCSSPTLRKSTPDLSALQGKKVALLSVEGEETARKVVEVALINQLIQRGTFFLISKKEIEQAQDDPTLDPDDWKGIAKKAGADYALRAKVLQFNAPILEGYVSETVEDSQLAQEQGTDGLTRRTYKAKSLEGQVEVQLRFTRLSDNDTRTGIAKAQEKVEENARNSSIHFPPQLRFLEKLSNKAFHDFFEQYN